MSNKRLRRINRQYGKQIKATENNLGSCMQLARYGVVDYDDMQDRLEKNRGKKKRWWKR